MGFGVWDLGFGVWGLGFGKNPIMGAGNSKGCGVVGVAGGMVGWLKTG